MITIREGVPFRSLPGGSQGQRMPFSIPDYSGFVAFNENIKG